MYTLILFLNRYLSRPTEVAVYIRVFHIQVSLDCTLQPSCDYSIEVRRIDWCLYVVFCYLVGSSGVVMILERLYVRSHFSLAVFQH